MEVEEERLDACIVVGVGVEKRGVALACACAELVTARRRSAVELFVVATWACERQEAMSESRAREWRRVFKR